MCEEYKQIDNLTEYSPPDNLLDGRVILVTGAGDGIGRAAARSFAACGATVILLGKTVAKLESIYDEIEQDGGPQPVIYPMDLERAQEKDYTAVADALDEEFGRLDGLLHNAALLGELCPLTHYDLRLWGRVMQVNLHAPLLLTRACLDLLKKASDGSILFTSDRVGRKARAYWGAYAISKFAIEGMMQILAEELETNTHIRVNSIDPGPTNTRLRRYAYPAEDPALLPKARDIMLPYLYLMGPDSRHINGQALSIQPTQQGLQ